MSSDQFSRHIKDAAPTAMATTRAGRSTNGPARIEVEVRRRHRKYVFSDPTADAVVGTTELGTPGDDLVHSPRDPAEVLISCEWCGANGSAAPNEDTRNGLSWSGLPVEGTAGDLRHRDCGGPVAAYNITSKARRRSGARRPGRNLSPDPGHASLDNWRPTSVAEQLFDDMKTLGYFTDNTRLAAWGPVRSKFAGARQRDREAAERSGPVEHKLGLAAAAFEAVLSNPATIARIHALANEYRAAKTDAARRGILARRPLQPVEKAIADRHKEECNPHRRNGRKATFETIDAAVDEPATAALLDFPEVPEEMLGWLPSDERTVTRMLFDGHNIAEIAEHLGYDRARIYRIKQRAIRHIKKAA